MSIELSAVISIVNGLGMGSVIAALVQIRLFLRGKKEDSLFDERKSSLDGLLVSYSALAEGLSDLKAKHFALCEARV